MVVYKTFETYEQKNISVSWRRMSLCKGIFLLFEQFVYTVEPKFTVHALILLDFVPFKTKFFSLFA